VDTSADERIKNSLNGEREKELIESLWKNHNVMLDVI